MLLLKIIATVLLGTYCVYNLSGMPMLKNNKDRAICILLNLVFLIVPIIIIWVL